ncbi:MAG TPA: ABC transporter permease [Vicinamibacterales bacterium]|nr:ABC transporter permease [Vicinamibacterales bacterium]HOQ60137.1 ABC transporter permease [Vicinamibacterales bacterium]
MKKVIRVAKREFVATAGTKAFILGILVLPLVIGALMLVIPRMAMEDPPAIEGRVAVIDPTGRVAAGLSAYLEPARIAQRRRQAFERMQEAMPPALRTASGMGGRGGSAGRKVAGSLAGAVPRLEIVAIGAGIGVEQAKQALTAAAPQERPARPDLALVVVHQDAVQRQPGADRFGTYDLFVRAKLDDRVIEEIQDGLRDSIVGARLSQAGLDRTQIDALTTVGRVKSRTVTAQGEGRTNEVLNRLIPMALMALLLMSVLTSGQYLLTTTVEEKTNRVVEVLLSAVSPMELMAGKILGQFAVGLLMLALYLGLGLIALLTFASLGLLDPALILFLAVFYLLAYFSLGAFMAAIGSAVNEMREAQGLMMPVMFVVMIPWLLWLPISRDPNSLLAVALTFVPPLGSFVIMLRLASSTPPPLWQTLLAIAAGAAGVWASLWFAARVFRIGLLMYGKPPSLATLVRWARSG